MALAYSGFREGQHPDRGDGANNPSREQVVEDLQLLADAGVPVVFSSHQLALVEGLCDRVGIIRDGTMVAVGTIEELRRTGAPPSW